jgi:exosome complex component RRP43
MNVDVFRAVQPREFFRHFLQHGVRADGRPLSARRKTVITTGSITDAHGSALVRLGRTAVLAAVRAEVAEPLGTRPDTGYVVVNVEMPPLCSADVRPGRPSARAQTVSHWLQELVNSDAVVAPESLVLEAGKLVWVLHVDAVCLNYDGNLYDAALLAVVRALGATSLPPVAISDAGVATVMPGDARPLTLAARIAAHSFVVLAGQCLPDPTREEELVADSSISVTVDEHGLVLAVQQSGRAAVPFASVGECVAQAVAAAKA